MRTRTLALSAIIAVCGGCTQTDRPDDPSMGDTSASDPGIVEVVARDLTLDAPDTVPPGWTTFRFTNTSPMIHFAVVERMPEGRGLVAQQEEVAPVFQNGFDLLAAGEMDAAMAEFGTLPAWFGEIVFLGGPGLTSPGVTSQASVYLEPGTYLLECYVKTDGLFHSYNPEPGMYGMVHEFTVTGEPSGASEPEPTLRLTISSEGGIEMAGPVLAGDHTVAVDFTDQTVHENFVEHDVHLVRLDEDADLEALERWMDWTLPGGLESPAPAVFLGGLNEMPAGSTGYFTVSLEPGTYAWIAEVPGASDKDMLVPFSVPDA
ncbi:MAG: hypothetical protein WD995_08215 [Gemmatimonadota bacterium]